MKMNYIEKMKWLGTGTFVCAGILISINIPESKWAFPIFATGHMIAIYVFATLKVSARSAVPRTATIKIPRIKPVIREIIVPSAMIPEARKSSLDFISLSFGPGGHFVQQLPTTEVWLLQ